MSKLQPVRGTHDILPDDFSKFQTIVDCARTLSRVYNFEEIITPIFEYTEVFARSMGDTSDVVSKEMYTFNTKGDESITLRPEFTAGIARAFISNGMQQHLPLKLFSAGPLFRYERPQKGRQRQFHQVNFEWLGDEGVHADVEIITLAGILLFNLVGEQGYDLRINNLGDVEGRARYRDALVAYLTPFAHELSEDSQKRLVLNPLRILDSKVPRDREIVADAPKLNDFLSNASKARFDKVCSAFVQRNIPIFKSVQHDTTLVRGLDYYTGTVFEFVDATGELGAQNTLLAGGRYDGLIEQMGGRSTPAIGFAAGVERLLLYAQQHFSRVSRVHIVLLPVEDMEVDIFAYVHSLAVMLRMNALQVIEKNNTKRQFSVDMMWQGSLKKRLEKAVASNASYVIIIGKDEFDAEKCRIKNLEKRTETLVPFKELTTPEFIEKLFGLEI